MSIRCKILLVTRSIKGLFLMKDISFIGYGSIHELNMLEIEQPDAKENQYDFNFVEAVGKEQAVQKIAEHSDKDPIHAIVVFCGGDLGQQASIEILEKARDKNIELRFFIGESDVDGRLVKLSEIFSDRGNDFVKKLEERLSHIFS